MVIAERNDLIPVKILISNSLIHLELFESKEGNLFLSSTCSAPEGTVYFATFPSLFCMFLENRINLQTLFNQTPSLFVEISTGNRTAVYSLRNMEIKLKYGDKTIKQLTDN